ncbi:Multidrug resistance protein MdtA [Pseudidiomarina piscicola]|uniref:Multidrug resistance protein MdtA n=1 Tax=Pseudidiomarina piscicola TaxID=2614830 RepID=A0A776AJ95_9GAMM|nr:efflux RND transporter periplasmic adaptor subunit [Pseudidiomarina piscicola]CAB0149957.1 Multidrug resistance protein MdtA [Pseudidiomarina piscicola]VZT39403.1 Multidrug resistance protein MdtA [Pseudomonas aeruginosa]
MKLSTALTFSLLTLAVVLPSVTSTVTAQQWRNAEKAALVVAQPLGFEREQEQVEAVAYAEALQSVDLYPAVGDVVTAVNFKPGERVEKGQVLVQLDDRRQRIALQRAKLQLTDAERTLKRLQTSREQGAVSQSQLDEAMIARDLLEVAVAEAQTNLDDRQVIAPFSGVIGITDIEVGDRITTQTMIASLDKRNQLYIDFQAPESAVALLDQGAQLEVYSWQRMQEPLAAEVAEIGSRVDNQNRTVRIRALMTNTEDKFRPGMSFRVALTLAGDSYPVIPEAGLMWGPEGAYVWIIKDEKAQRVDVSIKQRLPGRVLVDGNLQLGDQLIVEGVQTLRQGQAVSELDLANGGVNE